MLTTLLTLLLASSAALVAAFAFRIAYLSRRRKSSGEPFRLIGRVASVVQTLDPEGAVLVNGELWRARVMAGENIPCGDLNVRVTGAQGHLILVERVASKV